MTSSAGSRRAVHRAHIQQQEAIETEHRWRSKKSIDLVAFNAGAEQHFCDWLRAAIHRARTKSVDATWTISNAAYELDVSTETIKRYLLKHTADRAAFHSNGKEITLRQPPKSSVIPRNNTPRAGTE